MWTHTFWVALAERAARTFAQALAAFLVASTTGLLEVDWAQALSVSGMATLLSVLTSLAAGASSPASGPSLGTEVPRDDVAAQVTPGSPHGEELVAAAAAEVQGIAPEGSPVDVVPEPTSSAAERVVRRDAQGRFVRNDDPT